MFILPSFGVSQFTILFNTIIKLQFPDIRISVSVGQCVTSRVVQENMFTEKDYLGFAEQKDSDEIGGWQVGLEVVDFAYGAS